MISKERFSTLQDRDGWRLARVSGRVRLSEVAPQALNLDLQADEVIVDSYTRAAGLAVYIHCRRLVFLNGGHIDVTGVDSTTTYPEGARAVGPQHAGAHGADGAWGGVGQPGGSVVLRAGEIVGEILISANGGKGGRGQDGGNGLKGSTGPKGKTADKDDDRRGGPGDPGGDAGLPGAGGNGGRGGRVEIITLAPRQFGHGDVIRVDGGGPGPAGARGLPGEGGDGGMGGEHEYPYKERDPIITRDNIQRQLSMPHLPVYALNLVAQNKSVSLRELIPATENLQLQDESALIDEPMGWGRWIPPPELLKGSPGRPGSDRIAESEARRTVAQPGEFGTISNKSLDASEFYPVGAVTFYDLLMSRIEFDHIRFDFGDHDEFVARIQFAQAAGFALMEKPRVGESALNIYIKASAAIEKTARGLDFFGFTAQRVPLQAYEHYQDLYLKFYPIFQDIEKAFDLAWAENRAAEGREQAIQGLLKQQEKLRVVAERARADLEKEMRGALFNIGNMNEKVLLTQLRLMAADDAFKAAVKRKAQGKCGLQEIIQVAVVIAVAVQTGGAALAAAKAAAGSIYAIARDSKGSLESLWNSRLQLQTSLTELQTAGRTVDEAIKTIGTAVSGAGNRTLESPPEYAMQRSEFDRVASQFTDIPEAAQLRQTGYDFLAAVEARNQAIIDYNGMLIQYLEAQGRAQSIQQGLSVLRDQLSGVRNPDEGWLYATINRIYMDALAFAAKLVHCQSKALDFKLGQIETAGVTAFSMATIGAQVLRNETRLQEALSRAHMRRELVPGALSISLRNCFDETAWNELLQNGSASFALKFGGDQKLPNSMNVMAGLRVTGISLQFDGLDANADVSNVPWDLIHSGWSPLYGRRGFRIAFSHQPATISGDSDLEAGDGTGVIKPDFAMKGVYEGISPYTTWTLILDPETFQLLRGRMTSLNDIKMRISGHFYDSFG